LFIAKIVIRSKSTVSDPEGLTIHNGLRQLGYEKVKSVRSGKYFEIQVDEIDLNKATEHVKTMCNKLLANPIIEDYEFHIDLIS